jgi:hypothetical protein
MDIDPCSECSTSKFKTIREHVCINYLTSPATRPHNLPNAIRYHFGSSNFDLSSNSCPSIAAFRPLAATTDHTCSSVPWSAMLRCFSSVSYAPAGTRVDRRRSVRATRFKLLTFYDAVLNLMGPFFFVRRLMFSHLFRSVF